MQEQYLRNSYLTNRFRYKAINCYANVNAKKNEIFVLKQHFYSIQNRTQC